MPDAGGGDAFAFGERLEDAPFRQADERSGLGGQLLQQLFLALSLQRRNDGARREQICDFHDVGGLELEKRAFLRFALLVMVLQLAFVTPRLLLNLVERIVECSIGIVCFSHRRQHRT